MLKRVVHANRLSVPSVSSAAIFPRFVSGELLH